MTEGISPCKNLDYTQAWPHWTIRHIVALAVHYACTDWLYTMRAQPYATSASLITASG